LLKKALEEISDEEPSWDFTAKVTGRILQKQPSSALNYRPVISKPGWVIITCFTAILILLAFTMTGTEPSQDFIGHQILEYQPEILKRLQDVQINVHFRPLNFTPVLKISLLAFMLFGLVNIIYMRFIRSMYQ
jgi:hypothetical protein